MENNFKHTQGDWEIAPNKLTVVVNNIIVADCDTTDEYHSTKSEMEANAKLIAAAPKLLKALIAISEWDKRNEAIIGTTIINAVNSAIKKATE